MQPQKRGMLVAEQAQAATRVRDESLQTALQGIGATAFEVYVGYADAGEGGGWKRRAVDEGASIVDEVLASRWRAQYDSYSFQSAIVS